MAKFEINIDVNGEAKIASLQNNIDKLDKSNKQAKSSSDGLSSSLKSIGIAAGSYFAVEKLASALVGLGASTIQTASEFEKFGLILETLYGSSEKAQQSLGWIKEFSQKTPYTLKETTDAFVKLKSYGIEGTNGTLKTLGDTAAAMGKPLIQGVEAMADALTGENERLKEFGIKGSIQGEKIGYAWTDASGKSKHIIVENNKEVIRSTLEAIFNSKYEGAMEKLSGSFGGLVSNMTDSFDGFKLNIAKTGAFDNLKEAIKEVTKGITKITENQPAMEAFGSVFNGTIKFMIKSIGFFVKALIEAGMWGNILKTTFSLTFDYIAEGINAMVIAATLSVVKLYELAGKLPTVDTTKTVAELYGYINKLKNENSKFQLGIKIDRNASKVFVQQGEIAIKSINDTIKAMDNLQTKQKSNNNNPKKDVVGALNGDLTSSAGKDKLTEQQKLEKKAIDEKIKLENEAVLAGLDGYDRQFKALEQWKADELREYASVTGMKDVIDKAYDAKVKELTKKRNIELWDNYAETMSKNAEKELDSEIKKDNDIYEAKKKNAELIAGLFSGDLTETQSLNTKYDNLIQQMAETGQATNEQYEAVGKKYLTDLEKINQDQTNKLIEQVKAWGSIAQEFLTTAFNDVYDTIKDSYEPLIQSNQYLARSLDLQANMYKTFGQSGTGAVVGYQSQLATIQAQKLILSEQYDLMAKSMQFKKVLQPLFETAGLAVAGYSAISFNAQGVLSGTEFALNAQNLADTMTGFTDYQKQYISAVETFKEQMRSLADTLVSIAGSIYDAIPSFRDLYDTISGTNTYQIKAQIEALNYVKQYTNLDKNSLTTFVNDVLMAQSAFVTGAVDIAGSANEGLIQSVDIFTKYGLAVDSLNEKFANSLDVVANLILANEAGNKSILDFARTIRNELGASTDKQGARKTATFDFYKALSDYKKGNVDASTLLQYAGTLKGTLSSSSELKALALTLENVAQPQSTEDLLTKLNNQIANIMTVGMPVVNIAPAQSVEAQTLNVIEDTKSLIQQILDFLKNPIGSIADLIEKIIKAIVEAAEKIVKAVIQAVIDLAKGIFNLGVDIVKGFGNLLVDLGKTIVQGFIDAIKGIGGSVVGGAGDVLGDLWGGVTSGFGLWAQGGYTGYNNGMIDSTGQRVAGVVHEGEWVAPAWMVQSNSALFNALENSRLNNSAPQMGSAVLVSVNNQEVVQAININTNYVQSMNNRILSLEAMFRQVTTGGNAMMIEMI